MTGPLPLVFALCFLLLSLFLRFGLHGYSYLAHLSALIAASILLYAFLSRPFRLIWTLLLAAGALFFLLLEIPVIRGARTDADPGRKYLVVLGAEVLGTRPSRSLNYRLQAARAYLEQYPESIAVVSGGKVVTAQRTSSKPASITSLGTESPSLSSVLRRTAAT